MAQAVVGDIGAVVIKPLGGLQGDVARLLHAAAAFRDNLSSSPTVQVSTFVPQNCASGRAEAMASWSSSTEVGSSSFNAER